MIAAIVIYLLGTLNTYYFLLEGDEWDEGDSTVLVLIACGCWPILVIYHTYVRLMNYFDQG